MVLNLVIATSVSLVSLVGDVPLAAFRLNSRKAVLLKEYVPGHGFQIAQAAIDLESAQLLV